MMGLFDELQGARMSPVDQILTDMQDAVTKREPTYLDSVYAQPWARRFIDEIRRKSRVPARNDLEHAANLARNGMSLDEQSAEVEAQGAVKRLQDVLAKHTQTIASLSQEEFNHTLERLKALQGAPGAPMPQYQTPEMNPYAAALAGLTAIFMPQHGAAAVTGLMQGQEAAAREGYARSVQEWQAGQDVRQRAIQDNQNLAQLQLGQVRDERQAASEADDRAMRQAELEIRKQSARDADEAKDAARLIALDKIIHEPRRTVEDRKSNIERYNTIAQKIGAPLMPVDDAFIQDIHAAATREAELEDAKTTAETERAKATTEDIKARAKDRETRTAALIAHYKSLDNQAAARIAIAEQNLRVAEGNLALRKTEYESSLEQQARKELDDAVDAAINAAHKRYAGQYLTKEGQAAYKKEIDGLLKLKPGNNLAKPKIAKSDAEAKARALIDKYGK